MRTHALIASTLASAALTLPLRAQDAPAPLDQAALERAFSEKLSGAKLVGVFTDDKALADAPLQRDTYTLGKVEKVEGSKWRIESVIEYGEKSFTLPLVLDVLWAGDTPVITLTDYKVPMMGTFTARVLFYGDQYVGIWRGTEHGGEMFGRIERAAAEPVPVPAPGAGDDGDGDEDGEYVHWPSFRGRDASGRAEGFATATEWNVESGANVAWRVPLAGLAHSSPVIWGDRIYLTSAVREAGESELKVGLYGSVAPVKDEGAHQFRVLCLDKATGAEIWSRTAWEGVPHFPRHPKGSFAASTPATDGAHVVAFFGDEGLYCYDAQGELEWQKDFGELESRFYMMPGTQWGFSSSPVIHDGLVIVQVDVQEDSFVGAFRIEDGEEIWVTPRAEVPTWGTPTVATCGDRTQVICNGWKHIGGYDFESGEPIWWLVGGGDIPVPTPIVEHDLIFITNAHGNLAPIYAIEADAKGELSFEHEQMAWSEKRLGNYMQTPLVYGEEIYFCADNGRFSCFDARTGAQHYAERAGDGNSGFTASIVAADGKIYCTSEEGVVYVFRAGTDFEELAQNELGEDCMATPAISEGVIYWRTRGHLVAVEEKG